MFKTTRIFLLSRLKYGCTREFGDLSSFKTALKESNVHLRDERNKFPSAVMTVPARHSMGFVGRYDILDKIRNALFSDEVLTVKGLPLNTILGSAGAGKSRTLDALVADKQKDTLMINISFSGSFGVPNEMLTAGQLIASRMLFSYFVEGPNALTDVSSIKGDVIRTKERFSDLLNVIEAIVVKETIKVTAADTKEVLGDREIVEKCLELIRQDYNELTGRDSSAPVLCIGLGVDEVSKVTSVALREKIVRLLCRTADCQLLKGTNQPTFNVLFSTLHLTIFDKMTEEAQRPLNFIPLPLLTEDVARELLAGHIFMTDFEKASSLSEYRYHIALLAMMSAGHCRTIEVMIEAAEELRLEKGKFTLAELLETVASKGDVKLELSPEEMALAILMPVIDLAKVRRAKKLEGQQQLDDETQAMAALERAIAVGNLFATVIDRKLHLTIPPMAFRWSVHNLNSAGRVFPGMKAAKELLRLSADCSPWEFTDTNRSLNGEQAGKLFKDTHRLMEQLLECLYRGMYRKISMTVTRGAGDTPSLYPKTTAVWGPLAQTPFKLTAPAMNVFRPVRGNMFPDSEVLPVLCEHLGLSRDTDFKTLGLALGKRNCTIVPDDEGQSGYDYLRVVLDKENHPFVILTKISFSYRDYCEKVESLEKLQEISSEKPKLGVTELPWELLGLDRDTQVLHVNIIHDAHKLSKEEIDELKKESGVPNAVFITAPDLKVAYRGLWNQVPLLMEHRAEEAEEAQLSRQFTNEVKDGVQK